MAELFGPRLYSCYKCRNHVSLHDDIVSKAFQVNHSNIVYSLKLTVSLLSFSVKDIGHSWSGRHGRAFLFSHAMNIVVGPKEDRQLMTGLHTVADIYCGDCREVLGWKYERAYVATQKYKEGKFIIEKSKIVKENW
ncbi:hypothetical protein RHSIM_Rhsim09G0207400 [Rhododendron simsii]|uniref:Protein yippee-like n=1 Tax=Rhododendron simsii TaxID=118357 RepID=A0A834GC71_RHOSS|nr:hypothetical protein RHSIM_Rhsim09G0207400 [Rhododendron simsii]